MLFVLLPNAFANSPVGEWITIDDKTGDKRALVRLTIVDNKLTGTIVRVYPQPGDTGICSKCPGQFKDKPIKELIKFAFVPIRTFCNFKGTRKIIFFRFFNFFIISVL